MCVDNYGGEPERAPRLQESGTVIRARKRQRNPDYPH